MGDPSWYRPGRLPRRVGPDGRTTELAPNGWTIDEAIRATVSDVLEWMVVFSPEGLQIARFRGTTEFVDLSEELTRRSGGIYGRSVLADHVIVHNHPPTDRVDSFPPSPSDLALAVERDLSAMVVASGRVRYVVRRPGETWPLDDDLLRTILGGIQRDLAAHLWHEGDTLVQRVRLQHAVLSRLNQEGWIDFEQTVSRGHD